MILEYDTIILGSSLEALLCAAQKKSPVLFSDFQKPHRFEHFSPQLDLSFLNLPHGLNRKSLTTFDGEIETGTAKSIVWDRLLFFLSLEGHVPLSNLCTSMRFSDHTVTCFNEYSKIAEIKFNNCIYFRDDNINGLFGKKTSTKNRILCYDWIAFNKGGKHGIDYFETNDDFVKQVWFYSSDRIDGNTSVKDACVLSILNEEQESDFNYSETFARFKLVHEMESRGLKGLFNGYSKNGKPKYYKFKTSHIRRDKHYQNETGEPIVKGVQIAQFNENTLLKSLPEIFMEYDRFLGV